MEFGPSQSPAPTPPRPLHRWANEGRGWALGRPNCTGGRIQLGHGHYAHPIWMGARGGHEVPTMVGRSFGHDLAGACIVRRSLYSTQEFVPNDLGLYRWAVSSEWTQLANWHNLVQSGPKGGRGLGAFGPNSGRPQSSLS